MDSTAVGSVTAPVSVADREEEERQRVRRARVGPGPRSAAQSTCGPRESLAWWRVTQSDDTDDRTAQRSPDHEKIVREVEQRQDLWHHLHGVWTVLHFVLNIGAVGLTLTATVLPLVVDQPEAVLALSGTAAMFVAVLAFTSPSKQARSYIASWRLLDERLGNYRLDPSDDNLGRLVAGVAEGEKILAGKDPY